MLQFKKFIEESKKKFPEISRDEYKRLLDSGHVIKPAGLYEPEHAPKGTKFAHAKLSPNITRFVRIHPPDKKAEIKK